MLVPRIRFTVWSPVRRYLSIWMKVLGFTNFCKHLRIWILYVQYIRKQLWIQKNLLQCKPGLQHFVRLNIRKRKMSLVRIQGPIISGPVQTNALSFENAYLSMRFGLLCALIRWKRIDLKTLLKVDQNENAFIWYYCGWSKTHQNEKDDRKYRRCMCL